MDGYSIQEAAEVLGVPKRRIRELVERGVILGNDEGDGGLRVYLQPRPPSTFERQADRVRGPEASPFRELLSEFRNLTERYGQALLALGESRGEVAALRGRVEALETRMDLRLGTSAGPSVVEWHAPPPAFEAETLADLAPADSGTDAAATVEVTPEPVAVPETPQADAGETSAAVEAEIAQPEPETKQRPRRGISAIVAGGIAEALARAVDPSTGELPPPADVTSEAGHNAEPEAAAAEPEAAAAEPEADEAVAEAPDVAAEPDAAMEEELVAIGPEVDQSVYSAEIEEPDWLAEGEYTWLDAAQAEQREEQVEASAADEPEASMEAAEPASEADFDGWNATQPGADEWAAVEPAAVDEAEGATDEPEAAFPLAAAGEEDTEAAAEPDDLIAGTAPEAAIQSAFEGEQPAAEAHADEEPQPVVGEEQEAFSDEPIEEAPEPVAGAARDDQSFEADADAAAPVSGELPEEDFEPVSQAEITKVLVAEEHIFEAQPSIDVVEIAEELDFEAPPSEAPAAATPPEETLEATPPPTPEPRAAPEAASGEVPLMWLGGEFEEREEYAAEIEIGTAGWQTTTPPAVAGERRDELTRIAQDQGWDATEVEAIRSLLEPPPPADAGAPQPEREPEADDVPVVGVMAASAAPEPGPETQIEAADSEPPASAAAPRWPAEDHTVSFSLPGGDELRRALDALGLPASEQEREKAMAAQRAQWAKTAPRQGDATRALLGPSLGPTAARTEMPHQPEAAEPAVDDHPPEGEPEWLRGRRDPAARAYRRLRRIFPS